MKSTIRQKGSGFQLVNRNKGTSFASAGDALDPSSPHSFDIDGQTYLAVSGGNKN